MVCPRCNSRWDQSKNACVQCGLAARTNRRPFPAKARLMAQPLQPGQSINTEALQWNTQPLQAPPWVQQLASDARLKGKAPPQAQPPHPELLSPHTDTHIRPLKPGALLLNRRFRLYERQGQQTWLSGAFEAMWLAQDAQRGGAMVRICEFVLQDSIVRQSTLRTATMALHAISRHAHVPTLLDVFNDQERSFFVFEHIEGEPLLSRIRRTGRAMLEQEVIECCLQMTRVLEFLAQQSPPLVHGLIRPENIMVGRTNSHYTLLNFAIMLAGGATQFVAGIARSHLSPYTAPEFARGTIDVRSDIYALLATAYFLVTGSAPTKSSGRIIPARQLNPNISPQLEAILMKGLFSGIGLRPDITQRYQHPSELRQDLLAMYSTLASEKTRHQEEIKPPTPPVPDNSVATHPMLQTLASDVDLEEFVLLLPHPEDLPPLEESDDAQKAMVYLVSMLLCFVFIVIVSRGLI